MKVQHSNSSYAWNICNENGKVLIIIPYIHWSDKAQELDKHGKNEALKLANKMIKFFEDEKNS